MKDGLTIRRRMALEIARKMENDLIQKHPLRQLFWETTLRCNLACKHCGSDCRKQSEVKDMPAEDFLKVIDSLTPHVNPDKTFIIFTGGEPLMRKDLEVCGLALYKRGFPWGMVTNGLALTPQRFESLLRAGIHTATVSLDGFKESHNWMRGHPESFDKAVSAIKLMRDCPDIIFDVVTCVNKRSYRELTVFKEFLIELGIKEWRIFTIFPVGRAAQYTEFQLDNEEMRGVMEFIKETRKEGRIKLSYGCEGFLGNYEGGVRDHFYACRAGIIVGSILADGSISACPSIRSDFHQGNIYKDDFMEVWNNRYQPYRDRRWMKKGKCADCSFFRYCRGNGMHLRDESKELLFC
ncbi:MAG: TIGR04133 family radical SAM/SPASM protein, partial [Bacteroides sp.]|nr:TIGR04133 family radical SAM/SPASM protein [Bacteroides sp.]